MIAKGVLDDVDVERAHVAHRAVDVRIAALDDEERVSRELRDADAVVVTVEPLPRSFIEAFGPNVRIIGRAGIGLDAIDLEAARERGVAVLHTPDYATEEVATHTAALVFALNRKIVDGDQIARSHWTGWAQLKPVRPLSELNVGVVGLGRIGRAVARNLEPFVREVLGFDPYLGDTIKGVRATATLGELMEESDVLTLHLPLTETTRGLIGERELSLLPPGAVLVNVSRGALVDQAALARALNDGHLCGAGLDVLEVEPPAATDAILSAPNVILSPHFAWYSEASNRRMREMTVDGIIDFLEGREPRAGRLAVYP